ncbi:MAG: DUF4388 domain-containing protein, partial [Myxococcota bacterium]
MSAAKRPRSGRLRTEFGIRIRGVDDGMLTRRGDISLTGVFFELSPPREVGALGSVQALHIKPLDGGDHVEVMARIVRIRGEQRLFGPPLLDGIAFEFLPENDERLALLESMIRRCIDAHTRRSRDVQIELHRPDAAPEHATIETMGLQQMTLRSPVPLAVGHTVSAEVMAPRSQRWINVSGVVEKSTVRGPSEYAVIVNLESEATDEASLVDLIDELIVPDDGGGRTSPHEHLQGTLDRVKVTSLINLFSMDQASGILTVKDDSWQTWHVYFRDGAIVDAVGAGDGPVDVVHTLTALDRGEFSFVQSEVNREDRLQMGTT